MVLVAASAVSFRALEQLISTKNVVFIFECLLDKPTLMPKQVSVLLGLDMWACLPTSRSLYDDSSASPAGNPLFVCFFFDRSRLSMTRSEKK